MQKLTLTIYYKIKCYKNSTLANSNIITEGPTGLREVQIVASVWMARKLSRLRGLPRGILKNLLLIPLRRIEPRSLASPIH